MKSQSFSKAKALDSKPGAGVQNLFWQEEYSIKMLIRFAKIEDLEQMTEIYNQAISTQYATGDTEPVNYKKQQAWFNTHFSHKNPIFVAEMDGKVIGYNYLSDYRGGRLAFRFTMETSYYIEQHYQRKGIASKLMEQVIAFCQQNGIKNLMTFVMEHNQPSIKFLEKQGFQQWGLLPQIADFDGKEYNHTIYSNPFWSYIVFQKNPFKVHPTHP